MVLGSTKTIILLDHCGCMVSISYVKVCIEMVQSKGFDWFVFVGYTVRDPEDNPYLSRTVMARMDSNPFGHDDYWEEVIDDMEVTAAEYREAGWDAVELHPGDVAVLDGEQHGFDVLVPDDEFDQLLAAVSETTFDDTDVYRAEQDGFAFVLAVIFDDSSEIAICCPLYYDIQSGIDLREQVGPSNQIETSIRTLSNDRAITISHDDPAPFFSEPTDERSGEA